MSLQAHWANNYPISNRTMAKTDLEREKTKYQLLHPPNAHLPAAPHLRVSSSHQPSAPAQIAQAAARWKAVHFQSGRQSIPRRPNASKADQLKQSLKSYKSLNCSFYKADCDPTQKSKTANSEMGECRRQAAEVVKKLSLFRESQLSEKQVVSWVEPFCQNERSILGKLFLREKRRRGKAKHPEWELQTDLDQICSKLQSKLRDSFTGTLRFVRASEVQQLGHFLQKLYHEKNKIKMKEVEQSITSKMSHLCSRIRTHQNNEYTLALRKKPSEIADFLQDLHQFEDRFGPLKRITGMNRSRFRLVNDTDLLIDRQAVRINQQVQQLQSAPQLLLPD